MTTHERIQRMYEHREADRVPFVETPWSCASPYIFYPTALQGPQLG